MLAALKHLAHNSAGGMSSQQSCCCCWCGPLTCADVGSYKRAVIRDSWPFSAGPTNSTSFGWSSKRCCGGRSYLLCILPAC